MDVTLWKKAAILGGSVFVGTEILAWLLFKVAFGIPYFWLVLPLLQPFSELLSLLGLFFHPAWPINLVGWIAVGYYVVRRRSRGEALNPLSPETTRKIQGRVRMFLAHLAFSLICLILGVLLIGSIVWLSPSAAFDGAESWASFKMALEGDTPLNLLGKTARILAIILATISVFNLWYAVWLLLIGRDITMDYHCPYCGHSFFMDSLPDPSSVLRCPKCSKYIRRDTW